MFLKKLLFLISFFSIFEIFSQKQYDYYLIYLKDKPASEFTISNPSAFLSSKAIERRIRLHIPIIEDDLPINLNYITQLKSISNCEIWNQSKWLNAVEVRLTDPLIIDSIKKLFFVKEVQFLGKITVKPNIEIAKIDSVYLNIIYSNSNDINRQYSEKDYGEAYLQNNIINISKLHHSGFKGNGITIAVFDAGFSNAYKIPGMNIDLENIVKRDFVTHDNSVWEDDRHGANVLGFMKVNHPGTYIGTAPLANYILLRTEEAASEYPVEEVNWLAAAEFADSMGVDLISSSLGYNIFDDTNLSHHYNDLDGKTSIIAKAANFAHSKGIFIVVSAGNSGNDKWHKIGTPSDATGVITIGATDEDGLHADFSSYGPSYDGRVKPDFVAMGKKTMVASSGGVYAGNGTSYATPIFAGALACLIQACPEKSYVEIINALKISSTHTNYPDSAYGFGIPDLTLATVLLGNYLNIDTTKDIIWSNTNGTYWQGQTLHFRSSSKQTIELKITGLKKHKLKTISRKTYTLQKNEWLHNDIIFNILCNQKKIKKRKKLKELHLEIITSTLSVERVFLIP